ncbi:hypothetical protein [Catellatospora methionotrophica]|uniref:hypothetical protein n=1 Tax=Catellatospora methionotrophica TaxID=121620 RepID=UPI003404D024
MTHRHPRALPRRLEGDSPIDGRHADYLAARRRQVPAGDHLPLTLTPWAGGPQAEQWRPDAAPAAHEATPAVLQHVRRP